MLRILALGMLALTLLAPTVVASDPPPCTCDPNPIRDLVRCFVDDPSGYACPVIAGPDLPSYEDVKDTVDGLDPIGQPCTCDPPTLPYHL